MSTTIDTVAVPNLSADEKKPPSETTDEKYSHDEEYNEKHPKIIDPTQVNVNEIDVREIGDVFADGPRAIDLGEDGKERPIETDADYALRLLSLEDDETLPIYTFRMWFLAVGLSCFGAVLGQIFYFRPQTIYVSSLFLQIISYILGRTLEEVIPGPGETARIKTADTPFWRFMNGGKFSKIASFSLQPVLLNVTRQTSRNT